MTLAEWGQLFGFRVTWGLILGFFGIVYMVWLFQAAAAWVSGNSAPHVEFQDRVMQLRVANSLSSGKDDLSTLGRQKLVILLKIENCN